MNTSDQTQLDDWITQAKAGALSWSELAERLLELEHPGSRAHQPDLDRARRCGFGEVIFGSNKSPDAIAYIAGRLLSAGQLAVLVTRVQVDQLRYRPQELPI